MRYLGIDYGERRIGVALSDDKGMMAFPHSVISMSKNIVADVDALAQKNAVTTIVVGESNNYQGKANPIMAKIEPFVAELTKKGYQVILESELLSSHQAAHFQGKTATIDASAASIILQSYIDRIKY